MTTAAGDHGRSAEPGDPDSSGGTHGAAGPGDPVIPAVRWLLGLAAVLVFLAGVQLFLFPRDTGTHFAWTIASPMTAVFLGASYWSAVGLELGGARAQRWTVARTAVPAVLVFTTLTLVVTLVHLDRFHLDAGLPPATRGVTWGWLAVYAVVPVLMVVAWVLQHRFGTAVPPPRGLPTPIRLTLTGLAVVLVGLGMALLVAPEWAAGWWPWPLTPLTGRAVGAWSVGLGVAAGHARLVDDPRSLGPVAVTAVLFGVLQGLALLRYGGELVWPSVSAAGYAVVLAAITVVGAWLLRAARGADR